MNSDSSSLRDNVISSFHARGGKGSPKIVFVSGNFNIIHPGHQRLIQFAAECGDILVVGVNPDTTPGVMFPQAVRAEGITQLSSVDHVILLNSPISNLLGELKPDVVVKGKEHEQKENEEAEVLKKYGGRLMFGSGDTKFSSIDLLRREFENITHSTIQHPKDFIQRHRIDRNRLSQVLESLKGLRVLVIGDTIVDEYITCEALGLSQEDPTIVVNPIYRRKFIGGASIVAAHAAGLGARVKFFSVVGKDGNAEFVKNHLSQFGVENQLFEDSSRPTTLKQRYRTKEKTLLRVNELRQHSISRELSLAIYESLKGQILTCDLLVFSDFNYGCLPTRLVDDLVELGLKNKVTMVADSQSSSQIGDISRFKHMKMVTPTEREARLGVNDFESGLVVLCDKLIEKSHPENVIITLGSEGALIRAKDPKQGGLLTDQVPAFNFAPKDTAGAGDSLLITSSMAMARGANIWEAAYLGSLAAGIQVSRLGNTPLTSTELLAELKTESGDSF